MSLIKELIDLVNQLDEKITDRNIKDAFFPIKDKMIQIQQEMTDLDRKHWEEVTHVHQINTDLRDENSRLKAELAKQKPEPDHSTQARPLDPCPFCRTDSGELERFKPVQGFAWAGKKIGVYKCTKCGKSYEKAPNA